MLLGGNLVEERVFRPGTPVTFGRSLRCALSVPADGVPADHLLFAVEQGGFVLRVPAGATGRVVQPSGEVALRDALAIERGARGRLVIGEATVLFQEVAVPAIVPRPRLPASVRGTLADRIDRRLGAIVAASLLVHLGIAGWAWLTDLEHDSMIEEVAARYEAPRYEIMEISDLAVPDLVPAPAPTEPGPGAATPANPAVQTPSTRPRTNTPLDRLPEPTDPNAWAQLITGNQPGRNGQNELPNRIPDTDLDRQIQHVNELGREPTDPRHTTRDPGMRIGDGPPGPTIKLPQEVSPIDPKKERPPVARITPIPQPRPPGKDPLSIHLVLGRIQSAYMAGLQRCYVKHGLAVDASMVAKVTISFVVDETGAATEHQARGANAEVDQCIREQMVGWRFPVPKDADGDPTDAPFKLQLALQPSL